MQAYNATLNKSVTVETKTMFLSNHEISDDFNIGKEKM